MTLFDLLSNIIQRVNVSLRTTPMALSDFEKQQARKNIGIVGTGKDGVDGYTPQKNVDYFDGKDGKDGADGKDGYTPVKGVDYFDGKDGAPGKDGSNGKDGKDGKDGKTPVSGTDYFTEADKAEMVASVIAQLPVYDGEVVVV